MTLAQISPSAVTSAAHVSAQLVSMPRINARSTDADVGNVVEAADERRGRAPHDHGVLAVVLVVARPAAGGREAQPLVEPDGGVVGRPDLERDAGVVSPDAG